MLSQSNCPFCKIVGGKRGEFTYVLDADIILQTPNFTAFLGASKYKTIPCKVLLISNQHLETFQELPADLDKEYIKLVQKLSGAIQKATSSIGTLVWFQNGLEIQDISHFHTHILPRFAHDNFLEEIQDHNQKLDTQERATWVNKIKLGLKQ